MSSASRQHHHQRSVTSQRDQGEPRTSTSQKNNQNNEQQHIQLHSQTQSRQRFTDQEEGGHHARAESIEARSHYSSIYLRRDSTDSPLLFEMRGVLSSPPNSDMTNARLVEEEVRSHPPRAEMEEKVCKCTQPGSPCFLPTMHYNGVKCEHRKCAARGQHTIALPPAFKGTDSEGLFARQNTTDGTSTDFFDSSAVDPSSGKTYYYNSRTGERTWAIQHNT